MKTRKTDHPAGRKAQGGKGDQAKEPSTSRRKTSSISISSGFDALLIDEAHRYKRSEFFTKMKNIKGIDRASASRSCPAPLEGPGSPERTGGKNVILATDAHLQHPRRGLDHLRYVRPDLLEQFGARDFDSFRRQLRGGGQGHRRDGERGFQGGGAVCEVCQRPGAFQKMWRTAADIVLPEDVEVKRPKIKSGKPIDLQLERPEELARFIQWIKSRKGRLGQAPREGKTAKHPRSPGPLRPGQEGGHRS